MDEQQKFEFLVRESLARRGIEVDETDIAVIGAAEAIYGPEIDALLAADLSDIEPELELDPGRAPIGIDREPG